MAACSNRSKHTRRRTTIGRTMDTATIFDNDDFAFGKRSPAFPGQWNACKQCDHLAFAASLDRHARLRQSIDIDGTLSMQQP